MTKERRGHDADETIRRARRLVAEADARAGRDPEPAGLTEAERAPRDIARAREYVARAEARSAEREAEADGSASD